MGKSGKKGKKIGGMVVIKVDKPKGKPEPKLEPHVTEITPPASEEPVKLTKQQRRDRNKLAKALAEQAVAKEQGVHMSLKQLQASKKKEKMLQQQQQGESDDMQVSSPAASSEAAGQQQKHNKKDCAALPPVKKRTPEMLPPCPPELQLPSNDKDRFLNPSDDTFDRVMDECYKGCVLQRPEEFKPNFHNMFRKAMEGLEEDQYYQFDLTQPMGLGTRVAKTYVTRCLVGKPGITYKYLGLRMFAYPWTAGEKGATANTVQIGNLNNTLSKHTKSLLSKSGKEVYGSCDYNLTLINRCYPDGSVVQLKDEPTFQNEKCTVSWHADSSLQHYSTIAVYHCTRPEGSGINSVADNDVKVDYDDKSWRIALKQYPNAEGPLASKLKTRQSTSDGTSSTTAPPVAVPLPNQYSYFLLDDFNHNNQHSVLAGNTDRYASTHRVGRLEGHTYDSIKTRVASALTGGRGLAGAKQIRSDLLLQAELEFEWIRQFYIQGQAHYDRHVWWHEPMKELLKLWGELENRIRRHLQTLHDAGGQLSVDQKALEKIVDKTSNEYKTQRKQLKKRAERVSRIMAGSGAFDTMLIGLKERVEKRKGWKDRESDSAIKTMPSNMHPLKIPFPEPDGGYNEPKNLEYVLKTWAEHHVANWIPPQQTTIA
jgi:hypothetical protein